MRQPKAIIRGELGNGYRIRAEFPYVNKKKLYVHNPLLHEVSVYLQNSTIYECGCLRIRIDFNCGQSMPSQRIVSNTCLYPHPSRIDGCHGQVYPEYVQAHFSPPCAIFNQCTAYHTNR